ncbi:hypothetical protein PRELSG_9901600 [Plasmodium relictum]|uniref:Uncharacterized protein n=1 Tax=Plasmodium relictum TaxID=85471 RepID=A0A1J1GNS4_PLARL|nr:hypothetical protein PRELSG_9901600 [Plasmodium relictum]CRG85675.1 hypothetical protein PRELSG_9901600 [Plasmodium relictum]
MNISKVFNFFNLLLVSNSLAFIFNVNSLTILFNYVLLSDNYKLGFITKRNLAEMLQETIFDDVFNERVNFLSGEDLLKKYNWGEYLSSCEILFNYGDTNEPLKDILYNTERNLSIINGNFSKLGITLAFSMLMKVYNRIMTRYNLQEHYPPQSKNSNMKQVLLCEKNYTDSLISYLYKGEDIIDISNTGEKLGGIEVNLRDELHSLDIQSFNKHNCALANTIKHKIGDSFEYFNRRFLKYNKNEMYVKELLNLEYKSLVTVVDTMSIKSNTYEPISLLAHLIINTIYFHYDDRTIYISYETFKNVYERILQRVITLNPSELTRRTVNYLLNIYFLEKQLTITHIINELKYDESNTQENVKDMDAIRNEIIQSLQLNNITLSLEKVNEMTLRVFRSTKDII